MAGLEKFGSSTKIQRIGNDSLYGNGSDGNVVISSNTSLSRDMYYENLTINNGFVLNPNGFRIFVKNVLTVNGTLGIDSNVSVSLGTVSGTTPKATSTSNSIGGSAAGSTYTATQLSSNTLQDIEQVIFSTFYRANTAPAIVITGGAGGEDGVQGTVTPATAGSGATAGGAGGAGGAGSLNRNALAPGGPGTAGTPGTPGTNGSAGSTPPAAIAGVGARGGGVVLVVAKSILGSGSIVSRGSSGTAGGPSATGSGATAGSAGAQGNLGTAAPSQALAHYNDGNAHYRTGDGTHGPHATYPTPNLPHGGHVPYTDTHYHGYTYRYVYQHNADENYLGQHVGGNPTHHWPGNPPHHHNVSPFAHHYNDYHTPINHANFNSINGVYHGSPSGHNHHRPHGGVATWHYGTHYSGNFNNTHDQPHFHQIHFDPESGFAYGPHELNYWYRHHHDNNHGQWILRNAGTVSHVGHVTAPGGAAGARGSAGAAGTPGTNGSTTAGTFGKSGGGGGILIVTDSSVAGTISLSATGGTANSQSGSSGMIVTVLNT